MHFRCGRHQAPPLTDLSLGELDWEIVTAAEAAHGDPDRRGAYSASLMNQILSVLQAAAHAPRATARRLHLLGHEVLEARAAAQVDAERLEATVWVEEVFFQGSTAPR